MVTTYFIDEDYVDLFEMQMMAGRNFSLDFASDIANQVIINETAARIAGLKHPVGKTMIKWGQEMQIIGVVKDFHFTSFKNKIEPMVFSYNPGYSNLFLIRISDNKIPQTLDYVDITFRSFSNNFIFDYAFMDDQYDKLYKNESDLGRIIVSFSILTLIIAAIGLYGLITFVVRRKTKEIAIRKAMGASVFSVIGMILKSFFIPISVAILVSLPVACYFSQEWLNGFAYRINFSAGLIVFSISIIVTAAFISIVGQTIKAALAVPADGLRME
jgi:putative ABC transport system permease protein